MVLGNGLVVIVDDDDQVAVKLGGIVKALKRQATRKRAVANDGDDVVAVARQIAGVCQAAAQAHRCGGVAHGEQVVLGLVGIGKARSLAKTFRIDIGIRAPGQRLVGVGLVRNVKDNLVDSWGQRARRRRRSFRGWRGESRRRAAEARRGREP